MAWTASTVAIVVFGTAFLAVAVGFASLRDRPDPMALPLAVAMFAVAAWAIPHAISFGYSDVVWVAFWHRMRYPGTVVAPIGYLVIALTYARHDRWLSRRVYAFLAVIPVLTVVAVWTNPFHGLFWRSLSVATVHGASVLVPEYGPWFWVNLAYLYLVTVVSLLVLTTMAVRSASLYRKQATLMAVGGLVPLATNAVINFGAGEAATIDFTTTALAVSGLTFALALFHFDLLEVRPVARDRLFAGLDDGMVVIGPNNRVVDFNATAERVLEGIVLGEPADRVLPSDVVAGGELVVETDSGRRLFHMCSSALTDSRGRAVGRVAHLGDVTAIVEREQRIGVLNRVLRHNVRNELNIVTGHLDRLAGQTSPENRESIEKAARSAERVLEFADEARDIECTLRENEAPAVVLPQTVAERVVEASRDRFPGGVIEIDAVGGGRPVPARAVNEVLYEQSLQELVENEVVPNDCEPPRVTVGIEADASHVRVRVTDNGPGIPDHERGFEPGRVETELEHGSGLGLWLVRWTAWLSSGEVTFQNNEPRGSVVTLAVPAASGDGDDPHATA